jgi:peptidoglycan lytic transglycosylase
MRVRIAQGVAAAVVLAASLGAAQGPTSSGSKTQNKSIPQQAVLRTVALRANAKPYQVGVASWYGSFFQGKDTASGEPYNMYDLTAAHPTLPLGTLVKVTNLHNGRAIIVKVNDRGPVVPGRIIDLSYNAARALHFKNKGLQRVRLDVIHPQVVAEMHTPLAY